MTKCLSFHADRRDRLYKNFEDAKKYVLARREEMRQAWKTKHSRPATKAPFA
jgi:hypothetical protein